MSRTLIPAPTAQPMTLGRFVRVTLHNFRMLLNTFSGNDSAPPMSTEISAETITQKQAEPSLHKLATPIEAHIAPAVPAPNTSGEPRAHAPASVNEMNEATASLDFGADGTQPKQVQPELDLATNPADIVLTARTESGALSVRIGETSLTMRSALEGLLFVADAPVEAAQLARVVNAPIEVVESYLRGLDEEYRTKERGLRVAERSGRFQMVTTPAAAQLIETFLNLDMTTKLSAPALETLAIVAYRQPVTRAQVEAVRGVDCSGILRSLLQRGLIEEVDRLDAPGRPVLYGVTDLFMHHFGLTSLQELPPLQTVEAEQLDSAVEQ